MIRRTRFRSPCGSAACVVAIGLAIAAAAPDAGAKAARALPGCPHSAPAPATSMVIGAGPVLAASPAVMRLCRFGTLAERQPLVGERLTRSRATIDALTREFASLPPAPRGPTACPADTGGEVLLLARYRSGGVARITVQLSGCRIVTRGIVKKTALTSPALLARLVALT